MADVQAPLAAPFSQSVSDGLLGASCKSAFPPLAVVPPSRPPVPAPVAPQPIRNAQTSTLTHSLQRQASAAATQACGSAAAAVPTLASASHLQLPYFAAAASAAQQQQQQQQSLQQQSGYTASWPAHAAQQAPALGHPFAPPLAGGAPWPTLQHHAGPYQLFQQQPGAGAAALSAQQQQVLAVQQQQQQQQQAAVGMAAAGAGCGETRRRTRRRPTARRSLQNLFDAAAASEEASTPSDDSDSDCDMMCSQDSEQSSFSLTSHPSPFYASSPCGTAADTTPYGTCPSSLPSSACGTPSAASGSPSGSPPPGAGEHMLPLQHLLMSERAQHLSALEVKAIVFKVAADLSMLHDAGVLHRHVTIASVALARSGNLATARLMGHPYNVEAGAGRRYTGSKKAGVDAYLAPELARCPADCVAYTPAGDLWSLGVVLFVLLSGSHVPFGNRGLCWTSVPNMPGPQEPVDKLQRWLEEHLVCKLGVINQLRDSQAKGKAPLGAGPEMRVVGLDEAACDLLLRLLSADPAARPTARQVLSHPWLAEVEGLMPSPTAAHAAVAAAHAATPPQHAHRAPSPGFEVRLQAAASDLACLGFSPVTPQEDAAPPPAACRLLRRESNLSVASTDGHCEGLGGAMRRSTSAAASSACLADLSGAGRSAGPAPQRALAADRPAATAAAVHVPTHAHAMAGAHTLVLADGTPLQLLAPEAAAALAATGLLPDLRSAAPTGFQLLGYAVQPVEVEVEGRRMQLSALHAVFNVNGQPMLCAQPVAVTHHLPTCLPPPAAAPPALACAPPAPVAPAPPAGPHRNPDLGTSAPILPLLARMLQQQQ